MQYPGKKKKKKKTRFSCGFCWTPGQLNKLPQQVAFKIIMFVLASFHKLILLQFLDPTHPWPKWFATLKV